MNSQIDLQKKLEHITQEKNSDILDKHGSVTYETARNILTEYLEGNNTYLLAFTGSRFILFQVEKNTKNKLHHLIIQNAGTQMSYGYNDKPLPKEVGNSEIIQAFDIFFSTL